ncbi:hypothetical protein [Ensifer sp. B1-9]|uniref:hypothetical protein n=1 Tax=Ensifer sp. B1-9 TaxID=3141455 RepID=UPI003D1FD45D
MYGGAVQNRSLFACSEEPSAIERQEQWDDLSVLVRAYGEIVALLSFIHLGAARGLEVHSALLNERATQLLGTVREREAALKPLMATEHTRRHLRRVRTELERLKLARVGNVVHGRAMHVLSIALTELKAASAVLGTTMFDTTGCCARGAFANMEKWDGNTFRLGT